MMDILTIMHFLNGFLMLAIPIVLAFFLLHRFKKPGVIWWIGAATFVISQVFHIPFNSFVGKLLNQTNMISWDPIYQLAFIAVFLGLSAGIFEEVSRYLVLRWWARRVRNWSEGLLFGAGHGGAEAIILGVIVLYTFIQMVVLRSSDLSKIASQYQVDTIRQQLSVYWSMSWYMTLLGSLERIFAMTCQIAMALMVLQVFTRKQLRWLFYAIGYHALIDATAVVLPRYMNILFIETVIGGFAILSVIIIILLRNREIQTQVGFSDDCPVSPA
jgi:uncharacterized membrane protein YhfC